jgi:hypothetical protein
MVIRLDEASNRALASKLGPNWLAFLRTTEPVSQMKSVFHARTCFVFARVRSCSLSEPTVRDCCTPP